MASSGIQKLEDTCVDWQGRVVIRSAFGLDRVSQGAQECGFGIWEPPCHSMIPSPPAQIGLHMMQLRKFPANPSATAVQGPGLFFMSLSISSVSSMALGRYSGTRY